MFSGIVEEAATVVAAERDGGNLQLTVRCSFVNELKIDQSVAHNGVCLTVVSLNHEEVDGSRYFKFEYEVSPEMAAKGYMTVEKGSVTVNGVSLTVCDSELRSFRVAIIPYTLEHTNFCRIAVGTRVNLEFDIIGKYLARLQEVKEQ